MSLGKKRRAQGIFNAALAIIVPETIWQELEKLGY